MKKSILALLILISLAASVQEISRNAGPCEASVCGGFRQTIPSVTAQTGSFVLDSTESLMEFKIIDKRMIIKCRIAGQVSGNPGILEIRIPQNKIVAGLADVDGDYYNDINVHSGVAIITGVHNSGIITVRKGNGTPFQSTQGVLILFQFEIEIE